MSQQYASVHRSETTKRPFLSLDPVEFSFEGTAIPPPPPLPAAATASPAKTGTPGADANHSPSYAGPLSSHPVTPIENNGEGTINGFPFGRMDSNQASSLARPQSAGNDLDRTVHEAHNGQNGHNGPNGHNGSQQPELSQHQHNDVQLSNSPAYTRSTASGLSPPPSNPRQPSLASRFMRFRSISSLKRLASGSKSDLNSSNPSLSHQPSSSNLRHQYLDQDSGYGTAGTSIRASGDKLRGTKRPGSPSLDGNSDMGPPKIGRARANSASFPRLMRKKSMEWFGTARRKSGMWANSEDRRPLDIADFDDDASRNGNGAGTRATDKDSMMSESYYGDQQSQVGRNSSVRQTREPPPAITEFGDFGGSLDGHAMFATIGR